MDARARVADGEAVSLAAPGGALAICASTFGVCFVGALVPVSNSELWLVAVTLSLASPGPLPLIVLAAVAAHMLAKSLLYFGARGAFDLPTGRNRVRIERARALVARWHHRPALLLFTSSAVSVPPLYVTTLLAGGLGYRFRSFVTFVLLGRVTRFTAIVAAVWMGATW